MLEISTETNRLGTNSTGIYTFNGMKSMAYPQLQ